MNLLGQMRRCCCRLLLLCGAASGLAGWAQAGESELAAHQQRAQEAEARQDFATAITEYRVLVRAVPESAELESNLGVALYFHRDYKPAEVSFRKAITLKPGLYAPHLFLGLALAHDGSPDAAVRELEKAERLNGNDALVHTWLGYEYSAQMRFDLAVQELKVASQQKPDAADVWFALGRCHLELARAATEELLKAAPDDARTWQLAGEQYEAQGNRAKALEVYTAALGRRPESRELLEKVRQLGGSEPNSPTATHASSADAERLYGAVHRNEEEARAAFEQLETVAPDSYRVHQVLGDAAVAADRYDDAIREYQIVVAKNPELPGIHGDLCNALSRTARVDDAVQECNAELKLSPSSAEALVQAARVLLLKDDEADAAPLLGKAVALENPPVSAYKLLGKIELGQRRYRAAIDNLTKYTTVEKRDASAWFLLARAYKANGDVAKANQAIGEYKRYFDRSQVGRQARQALERSQAIDETATEEELAGPHPL